MSPDYFDIHSHIHDKAFDETRDSVLTRMEENNVWTITVGTDAESSKNAILLAEERDGVYSTIGIHPTDRVEDFDKEIFEDLVKNRSVVAIGECGLDYFRFKTDSDGEKQRQKNLFEKQLEFAVLNNLPLMIHCRDAHGDITDILKSRKREYGEKLRANIHFFTAGVEEARKYLDFDFTLSFPGVITFTTDYDGVVRFAPLNRIMSETDSPYVAPVPYRGKVNEPVYVVEVVKRIAEIKNENFNKTKETLVANAIRFFDV